MHKVYLGLGSNMGDKKDYLDQAVSLLKENYGIDKVEVSSYYATDPVGYLDQDTFLNIVCCLETSLSPEALLEVCQSIEKELNRVRLIHWGPRTIDVDILLYDDMNIETEDLIVPHKEMTNRAFVLLPLMELNQDLMIHGIKLEEYVKQLPPQGVRKQ